MLKSFILFLLFGFYLFGGDISTKLIQNVPKSIENFNPVFHFQPVNQDTTSICWSFATVSFIESEMHRINNKKIKLSVMYPVYYAFIEKAKHYIQTRGQSRFYAGDLFGTVLNVINKYGIVPENEYTGKTNSKQTYNHRKMYKALYDYMDFVKKDSIWDENIVIGKVKEILNQHIGAPPQKITFQNSQYSPKDFADKIINLNWNDYIQVISFKDAEYFKKIALAVPDNWLPDSNFVNVPLELFYNSMKNAIKNKYSLAIDGDFSEPGRIGKHDICIIPDYDIPSEAINQDARQYRFEKELTTDDHLMHIIGYQYRNGKDWFLVKDSWRDAFYGHQKGYFFMSDDYIKLKILAFLVHKDAIPEITTHFPN